jgi:hypothetical protein
LAGGEAEVIDRGDAAEPLGQTVDLDCWHEDPSVEFVSTTVRQGCRGVVGRRALGGLPRVAL